MRHNGNAMEVGTKQRNSDIWWIILIIDINFRWKKKWRICVELTTGNFSCEHFLFTLNVYLWWSFNGTRYVYMEWIQWSCAVWILRKSQEFFCSFLVFFFANDDDNIKWRWIWWSLAAFHVTHINVMEDGAYFSTRMTCVRQSQANTRPIMF